MSHYSSQYYPHADALKMYLQDYAARSELHIRYNVTVDRVSRAPPDGEARFKLTTRGGETYECKWLLWAAGLQGVTRVDNTFNLAEVAESYTDLSTDLTSYVNKSVLILGRGNAAFEVAHNILGVTSLVHLVGRAGSRIRLAAETHYPGDVRQVHSLLLETYLLKSQDVMFEADARSWSVTQEQNGWRIFDSGRRDACARGDDGGLLDVCFPGRLYDKIIACPGWYFDASPFEENIRPQLAPNGKHPALTPSYGSPGVPGLHFVGTAAHAGDYRVSSGGCAPTRAAICLALLRVRTVILHPYQLSTASVTPSGHSTVAWRKRNRFSHQRLCRHRRCGRER
jgi:hypothetical protein